MTSPHLPISVLYLICSQFCFLPLPIFLLTQFFEASYKFIFCPYPFSFSHSFLKQVTDLFFPSTGVLVFKILLSHLHNEIIIIILSGHVHVFLNGSEIFSELSCISLQVKYVYCHWLIMFKFYKLWVLIPCFVFFLQFICWGKKYRFFFFLQVLTVWILWQHPHSIINWPPSPEFPANC